LRKRLKSSKTQLKSAFLRGFFVFKYFPSVLRTSSRREEIIPFPLGRARDGRKPHLSKAKDSRNIKFDYVLIVFYFFIGIFDSQQSKIQNETALAQPLVGLAGRYLSLKNKLFIIKTYIKSKF